jgi:BASS family bile acid:Na+ symporter
VLRYAAQAAAKSTTRFLQIPFQKLHSMNQNWLKKIIAATLMLGLLILALGWWQHSALLSSIAGFITMVACCMGMSVPDWSGYRFTFWILIANIGAMLAPQWFQNIGEFSLTNSWLMLIVIQAIMFGMGTQMSLRDFAHVVKMPKGVVVGLSCQFTIMPLLGVTLAKVFLLPPEVAAGVILIGSCSSGLASNVMTFMAKGNLALSVTITAMATVMAPVMTPVWMKLLAGSLVDINAFKMSMDIVKMVLVPILAAFVHEWLSSRELRTRRIVQVLTFLASVWIAFLMLGGWQWMVANAVRPSESFQSALSIPGFFAAATLFGFVYHHAVEFVPKLKGWMPIVSMIGIVYYTLVTTAIGRNQLLEVGFVLVIVTFLHNVLGFFLGYWASRALGMNRQDARTIAIEVGMQNGAMGAGIARSMGKLDTVGLAATIFGPLMNITGSVLANHWRQTADDPEPLK